MAMLPSDEADLEFLFKTIGKYQASLSGTMLERALLLREDSDGNRVLAHPHNGFWRPEGGDQTMELDGQLRREPSYIPDVEDFHRYGMVSRRLNLVRRRSELLWAVLAAYYGDSGSRWREMAYPVMGDDGEIVRPGHGHGQIVSVYPLTEGGRKLVEKMIADAAKDARVGHRTIDEHLEAALILVASKPKSQAKQWCDAMRREADILLLRARSAYLGACAVDDPRRRRPGKRRTKIQVARYPELAEVEL